MTERVASIGEYIDVGEDVLRLVDTHRLEIALPAPIALARFVGPDQPVTVRNGKTTRQHSVRTVVPVGDAVSRMVEIRLSASDSDWLVGTPVQVSLPGATSRHVVAVPRDALVERAGQARLDLRQRRRSGRYRIHRRALGRRSQRHRGRRPGHHPRRRTADGRPAR